MYISEDEVMRSLKSGTKKSNSFRDSEMPGKLKKSKSETYYEHFENPEEQDNEIGLGGILANLYSWTKQLPKVNVVMDPIINFKLKQRIRKFGASITLGMDYLSELAQWRAYCAVEDAIVGGRFSLRGSELGWTKSWLMNLGTTTDRAIVMVTCAICSNLYGTKRHICVHQVHELRPNGK
jgi:hypothetical protein